MLDPCPQIPDPGFQLQAYAIHLQQDTLPSPHRRTSLFFSCCETEAYLKDRSRNLDCGRSKLRKDTLHYLVYYLPPLDTTNTPNLSLAGILEDTGLEVCGRKRMWERRENLVDFEQYQILAGLPQQSSAFGTHCVVVFWI